MPDLTEIYPLLPSFPNYGPHYILIWWNPNDHHHGIVVQDEESVFRVYKALFSRGRGDLPKPVEYWKVNIVRPPASACQEHAEHEFNNDLNSFSWWLEKLQEKGVLTWGDGFEKCPSYEPPPDSEDVLDDYAVKEHCDCQRCLSRKILWRNRPLAEVFLTVRDLWLEYEFQSSHYIKIQVPIPADAPEAKIEDGEIYCAALSGSNGFSILPAGDMWPPLFFFQGTKLLVPENVVQFYTELYEAEEKQNAIRKRSTDHMFDQKRATQLQIEEAAFAKMMVRLKEKG